MRRVTLKPEGPPPTIHASGYRPASGSAGADRHPVAADSLGATGSDDHGPQVSGIPCEEARGIAKRAHRSQVEPSGAPYIDHVRRVAANVPPEAASVAWLHDVLEWTELTEDDPALAGLAPHERGALALLTRHGGDDDDRFLSHLFALMVAPDATGEIARAVKRADMQDRLSSPRDPNAAWRPPYRRALAILAKHDRTDLTKGTTT